VKRPPTRVEWAIESEWRGHSPSEVIQYMSDVADWHDQLAQQRHAIAVPSAPGVAWWRARTWLRRALR
jgi:hypothetical protein